MRQLHPVALFRRWFGDWEDRILLENWLPIRFQPILFVFLTVGIAFVIIRRPTLPAMTEAVGSFTAYTWLVLAIICPPILFSAWLMIHFCGGRKAYYGFYARFAADLGQVFSYTAYMLMLFSDPEKEPEDAYSQIILLSILAFLLIVVLRDSLKLILLERTTAVVQDAKDIKVAEMALEKKRARVILDARDAIDVADARNGTPSMRDRVADLEVGAEESRTRESGWSQHQDHKDGSNG